MSQQDARHIRLKYNLRHLAHNLQHDNQAHGHCHRKVCFASLHTCRKRSAASLNDTRCRWPGRGVDFCPLPTMICAPQVVCNEPLTDSNQTACHNSAGRWDSLLDPPGADDYVGALLTAFAGTLPRTRQLPPLQHLLLCAGWTTADLNDQHLQYLNDPTFRSPSSLGLAMHTKANVRRSMSTNASCAVAALRPCRSSVGSAWYLRRRGLRFLFKSQGSGAVCGMHMPACQYFAAAVM